MRITGYAQDRGACTQLRIAGPLRKIGQLKLADVQLVTIEDRDATPKIKDADIIVMGRAATDPVYQMIRNMHHHGKRVVYDLDDNMFDVAPFSPHYQTFGIMPVNMDHPDMGFTPMWMDGQGGFDARRNRKLRASFISIIRAVDIVTVTTPPLQQTYSRFNDNVVIVPNAIDFGVWRRLPLSHDSGMVRVLYTGAANHYEDWQFVKTVLAELMKSHKDWTLVLVGQNWHKLENDLDNRRIEFHDWADIDAYPYLMRSLCCDIGIAPISKRPFNDCRSSIKWLEYSALKIATVATNYGPYQRDCIDGRNALLVEEKKEWYDALASLIDDPGLRKRIGGQAYRDAKRRWDLDIVVETWMDVFRQTEKLAATGG